MASLGWLIIVASTLLSTNGPVTCSAASDDVNVLRYNVQVDIAADGSTYNGTISVDIVPRKEKSSLTFLSEGFNISKVTVYFSKVYVVPSTHHNENNILQISLFESNWKSDAEVGILIGYSANITHSLSGLYSTNCDDGKVFVTGIDLLSNIFPAYTDQPTAPIIINVYQSKKLLVSYSGITSDRIGWVDKNFRKITYQSNGVTVINPCSTQPEINTDLLDVAVNVFSFQRSSDIFLHPDLYEPSVTISNASIIREEYLMKNGQSDWFKYKSGSVVLSSVIKQLFGIKDRSLQWLASGLSQYFKHKAISKLYGEKICQLMWQMEFEESLEMNKLKKSLPLYIHEENIANGRSTYFDEYKAGIIIKMLEQTIGETNFTRIINETVNNKNSSIEILLSKLSNFMIKVDKKQQNVGEMLFKWIKQPGYPIVRATIMSDSVRLSQIKLFHRDSSFWWIPVSIWICSNGTASKYGTYWLGSQDLVIPLPKDIGQGLMFNNEISGYYRVELAGKIQKLSSKGLRTVADSLALAALDIMDYDEALSITKLLAKSSTNVWSLAVPHLSKLSASLRGDGKLLLKDFIIDCLDEYNLFSNNITAKMSGNNKYKSAMIQAQRNSGLFNMTDPSANRVIDSRNSSISLDNSSMISILESFCMNGYLCADLYRRYFSQSLIIMTSNYTNASVGALCARAEGDQNLWDSLMRLMMYNSSTPVRSKFLMALACSGKNNSQLLDSFLQPHSQMKRQDFVSTISIMISSEKSASAVFDWLIKTSDQVEKYIPGNDKVQEDIITGISHYVFDRELKRRVKYFVNRHLHGFGIGRAMERMSMNCWNREQISPDAREWLLDDGVENSASAVALSSIIGILTLGLLLF